VCNELTRVLVKVYADDATIFLGQKDKPEDMKACLDLFCMASTARFNSLKTKIIPIGKKGFRDELVRTRKFNDWGIDEEIHIAQEGEAI